MALERLTGSRVFYPAAALYAALGLPAAVLAMPAGWSPRWHAHEMLFGFALAAVAGNQLGALSGWRLGALLAAWLAARAGDRLPFRFLPARCRSAAARHADALHGRAHHRPRRGRPARAPGDPPRGAGPAAHRRRDPHLITVGALGTLTFNVMAMSWLAQARRDRARSAIIVWGTALVAAATLLRVAGAFEVAALCWSAAYALLVALFLIHIKHPPPPGRTMPG